MSTPQVNITVEPSESGSVYYLPLGAKTDHDQPAAQLSLRLIISNLGASAVHLNKLKVSFTAPSNVSPVNIPLSIDIPAANTVIWNFDPSNNILLPFPVLGDLKLSLYANTYTAPKTFDFPLIAYHTSTAGGSYLFPSQASALETDEFWQGESAVHGAGSYGSQLFAYDMVVAAFDSASNTWSTIHPNTTGKHNKDLRIWGKPVTAVADGFVLEAINDVPNNPHPLQWTSDADLAQKMAEQQTLYWGSFTNGGAGNHFYIQHGTEVVLYAHMQKGSLTASLIPTTANPHPIVHAGDVLGKAGNAGNSTGPHLHVHAVKGTAPESGPLRPMPFHDALALDAAAITSPFQNADWSSLQGEALPDVWSAIYPAPVFPGKKSKDIFELAIDPLALVLRNDIYVLLTLPDPAPIETLVRQMREQFRAMSPAQQKQAMSRAENFQTYATAMKRAFER